MAALLCMVRVRCPSNAGALSRQRSLQASGDGDVGALLRQRPLRAIDDGDVGALLITMVMAMTRLVFHLDVFLTYPMQVIEPGPTRNRD